MSSSIYAFNIMVEAKVRAMVKMTTKYHPDWGKKEIERFLKNAVEYSVKKEIPYNEFEKSIS